MSHGHWLANCVTTSCKKVGECQRRPRDGACDNENVAELLELTASSFVPDNNRSRISVNSSTHKYTSANSPKVLYLTAITIPLSSRAMSGSTLFVPQFSSYTAEAFKIHTEANPHQSEVEPASNAWFDSYGVYTDEQRQRFIEFKFSLLASLCFPNAEISRFRTTMDFMLWYFSFQGMVDGDFFKSPEEMKSAMDAMVRAANDLNSPSSNFQPAAMIQSCLQRMVHSQPHVEVQRFVAGLDEYMHARFQEKFNLSPIPTLEECFELRRNTAGMNLWTSVFRYARGLNLPDQVVNHESLSELTKAGMDTFNMAGDIYASIILRGGAHPLNAVSIVMHHNGLDLQGSINFVEQLMRKRLDEYLKIKAKLPSFGPSLDEQVAQYAQTIEHCMHGHLEWAFMTPTYFGDQAESVRETGVVNIDKVAV
ncbi:isoprenoid synthase domain-containing protein [Rhizoctonia solani]|nr:isoprenoid synthase domain-containing protein [Rhizoctonia solani]